MKTIITRTNSFKINKIPGIDFEKCPIMSPYQKSTIKGAPANDVSRCPQPMTTSGSNMVPTVAIATAQCSSNDEFEHLPASRKNCTDAISTVLSQNVPHYIPRKS